MIIAKRASEQSTAALPSIQMLRAVAALAVLFCHLKMSLNWFGYSPNPLPAFVLGGAGVDLFFVISGFIMVYTSERLFAQPGAPQRFFSRRLIRILPLYWALTTIAVFGWHGLTLPWHLTWTNVIGSYLLIPTMRPGGTSPASTAPELVQAWTLYYEMFFYAMFAAVIVLPRRLAVIALSLFFVVIVSATQLIGSKELSVPWNIWSVPIIYEFVFGMWVALALRAGWRVHPAICCVVTVTAVAFMAVAAQFDLVNGQPMTSTYSRPLIWGTGTALVVACFALADVTQPVPMLFKPLVIVGDASYALYLFHTFVPYGLHAVHAPRIIDPAVHPFVYSALTAAIAIASALVLNVGDQKCRTWLLAKSQLRPALVIDRAQPSSRVAA